jgi:hypothetical protein
MGKRGLFIFMGESFRSGGTTSRIVGLDESYDSQMQACYSHSSFVEMVSSMYGCIIDVYISTYNTKFNDKLLNAYTPNIIGHDLYDNRIGTKALLENALNNIHDTSIYDFILLLRIDIIIKPKLYTIFNPDWDTIRFACISWIQDARCGIYPRVNPILVFVPKKYYEYIIEYIDISCHSIWKNLILNANLKTEDMDVMINTYNDADSEKGF